MVCGPIWLGDNSSMTKKVIARLDGSSGELDDDGQSSYYGTVGGSLITGNEDGLKHCTRNILYSLQHLGCTIPRRADAGWIGEVGPACGNLRPAREDGARFDFENPEYR